MKKIALLLIILIFITIWIVSLSACSVKNSNVNIINIDSNYRYFYTQNLNEYLNYLQQLEENGYKIVNIDTCPFTVYNNTTEFYAITYKMK